MKNKDFGTILKSARLTRSITLRALSDRIDPDKDSTGHLSRLERNVGDVRPRPEYVKAISRALSLASNDGFMEQQTLMSELLEAAGHTIDDEDKIKYIRRKCERKLINMGLGDYQVRNILHHVSVSAIQWIAEEDDITVVDLTDLSSELDLANKRLLCDASNGQLSTIDDMVLISAGPGSLAKLLVPRNVTSAQRQQLEDLAHLIESILR